MELLVCVVNRDEKLEEILSGFLELGVTGATVIHTEGMGRVLSQDVPVFAGLQTLMSRSRPQNTTILSVIESPDVLQAAIDMVQRVCGSFAEPSTGILFTVPLNRVVGLAPELAAGEE
jgi:nitrogen regulatory protein P-II 1